HDALAVAAELAPEVEVEVFDPRTLHPFDFTALFASVGRTGRAGSGHGVGVGAGPAGCGPAVRGVAMAWGRDSPSPPPADLRDRLSPSSRHATRR
ncbi:transketolase C-terminal domain-containing protein, partial [Kitasatospora sp. LaBMicrA B282]|uniref:transketolase C-terminal domain-containing protein n=1 Tax=Kitasatospora sp. LaBMicrA B282 TaxID=3420949 RepID=UPI003D138B1D